MSKSIEQHCLTQNGDTIYYLQFHIKPWMKDMPYFQSFLKQYPNRKNIKESLKTSNLHQALERMEKRLTQMKLFWSDKDNFWPIFGIIIF